MIWATMCTMKATPRAFEGERGTKKEKYNGVHYNKETKLSYTQRRTPPSRSPSTRKPGHLCLNINTLSSRRAIAHAMNPSPPMQERYTDQLSFPFYPTQTHYTRVNNTQYLMPSIAIPIPECLNNMPTLMDINNLTTKQQPTLHPPITQPTPPCTSFTFTSPPTPPLNSSTYTHPSSTPPPHPHRPLPPPAVSIHYSPARSQASIPNHPATPVHPPQAT